jgi:3-oxoacyl-[acyl-carrier-protein] synthase-3
MPNTKILALGHYMPPNIVTNEYLASTLELLEEEIVKRTGIEERRYVDSGTSCSELALHAVENAVHRSGLFQEIDLIIFATLSPDHFFPGSGCFLQARLKLASVTALDIRNQCSGFLYGLANNSGR